MMPAKLIWAARPKWKFDKPDADVSKKFWAVKRGRNSSTMSEAITLPRPWKKEIAFVVFVVHRFIRKFGRRVSVLAVVVHVESHVDASRVTNRVLSLSHHLSHRLGFPLVTPFLFLPTVSPWPSRKTIPKPNS